MSQVEVCGSDVVRLMADLKDWEKLFVQFECVLTWEKPLVLLYTFISITVFYAFLWLFEPPLLVSLGCLTLTFSLWFYFGPKFALNAIVTAEILTYNYDGILIAYILTICALLTPGIRHTGVIRIFYLVVKKSLRFIWRIISQLILFLYRLIPATSRDSGQLTEGAAMTK
uniref:Conserved plasma membrane protein n=1 Tax=Mesocestoides corti TaxID=53468 RepID=A0A5K3FIN5_MESCO